MTDNLNDNLYGDTNTPEEHGKDTDGDMLPFYEEITVMKTEIKEESYDFEIAVDDIEIMNVKEERVSSPELYFEDDSSKLVKSTEQSSNENLGEEAKNAWTKLRNCHCDAKPQPKSGSGGDTSAMRLKFQKQMKFSLMHSQNKSRESNLNDSLKDICREQVKSRQVKKRTTKRKRDDDIANIIKVSLARQELRAKERNVERNQRSNALYHFFMSMYGTTKHLPIHLQHIVKCKIFAIMSATEAEHLNLSLHPYSFSQSKPTSPTPQSSSFRQFSFDSSSQPKSTPAPPPESSKCLINK